MFLVGSAGVKHQKDTEKADSVVGAGASRSLLDLCSRAAASDTVQWAGSQSAYTHTEHHETLSLMLQRILFEYQRWLHEISPK